MVSDARIPLVSFTGSTTVGKEVNTTVAKRLGRTFIRIEW